MRNKQVENEAGKLLHINTEEEEQNLLLIGFQGIHFIRLWVDGGKDENKWEYLARRSTT